MEEYSLEVRDAYKTYDGMRHILKGLNMKVIKGTIYGLLGASGCGKSTLLNAIVGLMPLDGGEIKIAAGRKRNIGFMPQEISLHHMLKTEEVFYYYGTMYGMTLSEIKQRISFLYNLLQLPEQSRLLNTLSGGQMRRVSLAVSLIHDPALLILDEPTVGVDPLLRQRLWEHLLYLCKEGKKTIVITTHYIEETRQANTVGLMREGVLLCEEKPHSLMSRLNCNTLEDAFLLLSEQQVSAVKQEQLETTKIPKKNLNKVESPLTKSEKFFEYTRFKAELRKNIYFLLRNIPLLLYIFGLPIASCSIFNFGTGNEPNNLNFGVVAEDLSQGIGHCTSYMRESFQNCDKCILYEKMSNATCTKTYLACHFLKKFEENSVILREFHSVDEGIEAARSGDVWGLLHFPKNYSKNLADRIYDGRFAEDSVLENSLINVHMDRTNRVIDELLKRNLRNSFNDFISDLFVDCGWESRAAHIPIQFLTPVHGKPVPSFRDSAAPVLTLILLFSMPLVYGVVIIIEEKNSGATGRSIVAGVNLLEVMLSHCVVQVLIQAIQTFSTMFMMYYLFGYQFSSPLLSTALLLLMGFSGVSLGFVVAILCDTLPVASCVCTGWVLASIMLGGMIWPQQGIHPILQPISWIMPITLPAESLRRLTQSGWDLSYTTVWLGFAVCLFWTSIFSYLTVLILKKTKAKAFLSKKFT